MGGSHEIKQRIFALLIPLLLFASATAQSGSGSLTANQVLNDPRNVLAPDGLGDADTAIAIRTALIVIITRYDIAAACHPTALTFFGTRETQSAEFCSSVEQISIANLYARLRAYEFEYPTSIGRFANFLRENGFDPDDRSMDKTTAVGYGNFVGTRLSKFFVNDGWNVRGDLTRKNFRQQYEDYSNYKPVNSPTRIRFPLRWQPLTQSQGLGRFTSQVHVVPFLGRLRTLVLTPKEVQQKKAPKPYRHINSPRLRRRDARTLDRLIQDLFDTSAKLSRKQRFYARFWENKFISLGSFAAFYPSEVFGDDGTPKIFRPEDSFGRFRWGLGEMVAQFDAVIVAWKEKRRFDVLRPVTGIKQRYRGRKVRAFVSESEGVKTVRAEDWQPIVSTQPHSEYPSASSLICSASWEHARYLSEEAAKANGLPSVPPPRIPFNASRFPSLQADDVTEVGFDSFEEAAVNCGMSRLWAGVHFRPSIPAGLALGKGIGKLAYEFVRDLVEGRVPERCVHCRAPFV